MTKTDYRRIRKGCCYHHYIASKIWYMNSEAVNQKMTVAALKDITSRSKIESWLSLEHKRILQVRKIESFLEAFSYAFMIKHSIALDLLLANKSLRVDVNAQCILAGRGECRCRPTRKDTQRASIFSLLATLRPYGQQIPLRPHGQAACSGPSLYHGLHGPLQLLIGKYTQY